MSMFPLSKRFGFLTLRRKHSYTLMPEAAVEKRETPLNGHTDSTGQNQKRLVTPSSSQSMYNTTFSSTTTRWVWYDLYGSMYHFNHSEVYNSMIFRVLTVLGSARRRRYLILAHSPHPLTDTFPVSYFPPRHGTTYQAVNLISVSEPFPF